MKKLFTAILLVISQYAIAQGQCSDPKTYTDNQHRHIVSNGINCSHGKFPNAHNPNTISAQNHHFQVPLHPQKTGHTTPTDHYIFGVALNGIPFDPNTAEFWDNNRQSGWNYDAMTGFTDLGLDFNHAHVQPTGAYHYHGTPTDLVKNHQANTMLLLGYAADGFPIYYKYGYKEATNPTSPIAIMQPSYRLKTSTRPNPPGGIYSGAFTQDFEYVQGLGDLDDCNGMFGITPEYPKGIYHYYITDAFPFIPRCFKGTPDQSFAKRPHRGGVPAHL